MTVLENFVAFASTFPADRLESVEQSLAALKESLSPEFDFTPAELAELDHRATESKPDYAHRVTVPLHLTPHLTAPNCPTNSGRALATVSQTTSTSMS